MPRSIEGLLAFFELWVGSPYKVPSATWDHAQDEIGVMIRRGDGPDREKTALHGQWDQKQSRSVAIIIIADGGRFFSGYYLVKAALALMQVNRWPQFLMVPQERSPASPDLPQAEAGDAR